MKIGVVIGNQRKKGNCQKVGEFVKKALVDTNKSLEIITVDLGASPLPLWDEGVWAGEERWTKILAPISQQLSSCDGFVVLTPEYAGMASAAIKNFFLLFGSKELGHKPGLIVSVSSGRGGSYPIAELRASSYKNSRIVWIPDHVIVRDADNVLNQETSVSESDTFVRKSLNYHLTILLEYTKNLRPVRDSGVIDYKSFPFGM